MDNKIGSKIVTFYSFKGGVGRTMALANVAFLAARSNLRVLIMDWDLEAPGLLYYFRGLSDGRAMRHIRSNPGVLDVLWQWMSKASNAGDESQASALISEFLSGEPFARCVSNIVDEDFLYESEGCLHYIGAGAPYVSAPIPVPYEEALASFSWKSFFEEKSGGVVIKGLQDWAKRQYDLVLIDSRTGLADVSGICTMQIPDIVALCFILNRQNIDGVAHVSDAIRRKRGDSVAIRAVPMRITGRDTSEESDARARAITELTRVGGFSADSVVNDMQNLGVDASKNVPFYETLSIFSVPDPSYDPLTLQYVRLANELLGVPVKNYPLSNDQIDLVRMRLRPSLATVEYINKLKTAEPGRALTELKRLIASAMDYHLDDGLSDREYIEALVDAVYSVNEADEYSDLLTLQEQALNLVRELKASDPLRWGGVYIEALVMHLQGNSIWLEGDERLVVLNELEAALSTTPTERSLIRRVKFRLMAAWIYYQQNELDKAGDVLALVTSLLRPSALATATCNDEDIASAEAEVKLLEGDIAIRHGDRNVGIEKFQDGLRLIERCKDSGNPQELSHLELNLIVRLATTKAERTTPRERALYASRALDISASSHLVLMRMTAMFDVILEAEDPKIAEEFFRKIFSEMDKKSVALVASFNSTPAKNVITFFNKLGNLIGFIAANGPSSVPDEIRKSCAQAAACATRMLSQAQSKRRRLAGDNTIVFIAATNLQASLALLGYEWEIPSISFDGRLGDSEASGG